MSARLVELIQKNSPQLQGFDLFWEAYPRKQKKIDAQQAWLQMGKLRPPIEKILGAIETQKRSLQWVKDCGEYIPLPATWLRAGQWDDE
jgi:hypothetical protein